MTRLLVVDGSPLMAWLVGRVAPAGVEVEAATSFRDAARRLASDPPDAAIFNFSPCQLGWRELIDSCLQHRPRIPFLCSSALDSDEIDDDALPCRTDDHFAKPIPVEHLRRLVEDLVEEARSPGGPRLRPGRERFDDAQRHQLCSRRHRVGADQS